MKKRNIQIVFYLLIIVTSISSTFARTLVLPQSLISYQSPQSEKLFQESVKKDFWPLSRYYISQITQAYCGIASSAMILNALGVKAPLNPITYPYPLFTQQNIFTAKVLAIATPALINFQGLTLQQVADILKTYDLKVQVFHAADTNINRFRQQASQAVASGQEYVMVNFSRKALSEEGYGHISPLAAYNAKTDQFLMLDVARYKYPPTWVKTALLWKAMDTLDKTSHKSRGYLLVKR